MTEWIDAVKVALQRGDQPLTLAHLVVEANGRVQVVELLPGGRAIAETLVAQVVSDQSGSCLTRIDGLPFIKALVGQTPGENLTVTKWVKMPAGMAYQEHDKRPPCPTITVRHVHSGEQLYAGRDTPIRIGTTSATLTWKHGTLLIEPGDAGAMVTLGRPETGMTPVAAGSIVYPEDHVHIGDDSYEVVFDAYTRQRLPIVTVSLVEPFEAVLHQEIQVELTVGSSSTCNATIDGVSGVAGEHIALRWKNNELCVQNVGSQKTKLDKTAVGEDPIGVSSGAQLSLGPNAVVSVAYGETRAHSSSFDYFFVYDSRTRTFPKRMWVAVDPNSAAPPDAHKLDGRVMESTWEAVHKQLKKDFPQSHYVVNRMSATSWSSVEDNFHGMYFYSDYDYD